MAQKNYNYVVNILASKLKDRIESYNERRAHESRNDEQVTVDPNDTIVTRRKRSNALGSHSIPSQQVNFAINNRVKLLLSISPISIVHHLICNGNFSRNICSY
jgi:hypothetical protein